MRTHAALPQMLHISVVCPPHRPQGAGVFLCLLYVPRAPTLMKKTSKPDLQTLVDTLKVFNNVKESESSWAAINTNITLLSDLVQTRQDAVAVLDTLHPLVQSAMLSDRSRLSGSALHLLRTCAERGANMNNYTYFLPPLFKLVNRPSKVFSQRAEEVLVLLCKLINIDRHAMLFKDMFRSANKLVRLAVIKVVKHSSHPDLKGLVERAQTDASAEVRSEAKSHYSPLKKAARTADSSVPPMPVRSGGAGESRPAVPPKEPETCWSKELGCVQGPGFAEKAPAEQRPRAPSSAGVVRLGGLSRLHATRKRGISAGTVPLQGRTAQDGDNLTPNTLSRYLKNYQKSVLNKEAEASLLHKIKKREEIMKEFTSYAAPSSAQKPSVESFSGTPLGSSSTCVVSPSLRASVSRLLGEKGCASDGCSVPPGPSGAAAQKRQQGLAYDNPGLKLLQDFIWVSHADEAASPAEPVPPPHPSPASCGLRRDPPTESSAASSASAGLFTTDIQTLIDGKAGGTPSHGPGSTMERSESFVGFLLKTGDKLSEMPDAAAESLPADTPGEQHSCLEASTVEGADAVGECAESLECKDSGDAAEADVSFASTCADQPACEDGAGNASFQTMPRAEEDRTGPADEDCAAQSTESKQSGCSNHDTTAYEDMPSLDMSEQLSCDISRLSLHERDADKTVVLEQCVSTNGHANTSGMALEENLCDVADKFALHTHDTVCMDGAEGTFPCSSGLLLEISMMENAGSSTEFTEIDSVIFANKKTMARKKDLVMACVAVLAVFLRNLKRMVCTTASTLPRAKSLLLIAHPDDESMFFAPTLLHLHKKATILCLSSGGYYGEGAARQREMRRLCAYLGVKAVILGFEDNGDWSPVAINAVLEALHRLCRFKYIYTFDSRGVSGHKNHVACHAGAKAFSAKTKVPVFYLKSTGLFSKYCFDLGLSKVAAYTSINEMLQPLRMMLFHRSQLTWYRWVYILVSNYMQYNDYI
ncbi:UNVERIFIED_CONTAM: hypothetical protein PYX00_011259 [Menopon gallinae]|uniref:N-acetylglucosaminylphosphatidylinositol deacetylase n=1 Tax=Menopon gallinae TaxID=328185 RepID=A0AAW2H6Y7_9NEOP